MKKSGLPIVRTIALLAVAAALLAVTAAGCATTAKQSSPQKKGAGHVKEAARKKSQQEPKARTDVSENQAIVDAAAKINDLRKADNPDYAEIEKIFSSELKEMVGKRDGEAGTTLVADIESAIAAGKAGTDVTLNGQRISKTLIRAFYLSVKHEFEAAETSFADKSEEGALHKWDEAQAYWGGVRSMGYFEEQGELIARVEEAFENGRKAIAGGELLKMKLALETIDKISIRGFVGAVIGEADEAKGADGAAALEKVVEAQVLYSAVADKFEAHDQQISAALVSAKTANPDTLRALFGQGLADKAVQEAEEVIGSWGTDKAAVVAREAGLYMETLQEVTSEKPVGDLSAIQDQVSRLEEAVGAGDKTKAERLVADIVAAVNGIKSGL